VHALVFGAIALVCYLSPETAIGDAGWLPLPRLAVLCLAAALSALVILLVGSALSGNARQIRLALLASVALDIQVPVFMGSQPAFFDFMLADLGVPGGAVWLVFVVLVGVTVYELVIRRRVA
jgi:hypothetical protein